MYNVLTESGLTEADTKNNTLDYNTRIAPQTIDLHQQIIQSRHCIFETGDAWGPAVSSFPPYLLPPLYELDFDLFCSVRGDGLGNEAESTPLSYLLLCPLEILNSCEIICHHFTSVKFPRFFIWVVSQSVNIVHTIKGSVKDHTKAKIPRYSLGRRTGILRNDAMPTAIMKVTSLCFKHFSHRISLFWVSARRTPTET